MKTIYIFDLDDTIIMHNMFKGLFLDYDKIQNNHKIDEYLDDEKKLINFMANFPKLIERPIIIRNEKAVIGRPIENIFNLI